MMQTRSTKFQDENVAPMSRAAGMKPIGLPNISKRPLSEVTNTVQPSARGDGLKKPLQTILQSEVASRDLGSARLNLALPRVSTLQVNGTQHGNAAISSTTAAANGSTLSCVVTASSITSLSSSVDELCTARTSISSMSSYTSVTSSQEFVPPPCDVPGVVGGGIGPVGLSAASLNPSSFQLEVEDSLAPVALSMDSFRDLTISDIDAADRENAQYVTEYVNEIFGNLRSLERKYSASANYMAHQVDINAKMRAILVDWLVDVHLKFKLQPETMYLTVNLIDRFLTSKQVARQKLQLVGVTAMLLASKYEEIFAPEVRDFVYISDKAYSREEILRMEAIMLSKLGFNLTISSPLTFVTRFVKAAGSEDDKRFQHFAEYLSELTLQEYKFLKYLPSMIAASSVYLALRVLKRATWDSTMEKYTQFTEAQLKPCVSDIYELAKGAPAASLRAVHKKYSNTKFWEVSKIPLNLQ